MSCDHEGLVDVIRLGLRCAECNVSAYAVVDALQSRIEDRDARIRELEYALRSLCQDLLQGVGMTLPVEYEMPVSVARRLRRRVDAARAVLPQEVEKA